MLRKTKSSFLMIKKIHSIQNLLSSSSFSCYRCGQEGAGLFAIQAWLERLQIRNFLDRAM